MYYHVLVETIKKIGKTKTNEVITEIDKSDRNEILNDIVKPYIMNEEFIVNGYFLKREAVSRLKIMTTEQSARQLSKYENDNMPDGLAMYVSPEDILNYDKYITDITKDLITEVKSVSVSTKQIEETPISKKIDRNKVFIVHGHDGELKEAVARLLDKQSITPIILSEQANNGKTIIEKLEGHSDVRAAIVLFTKDDICKISEEENTYRARQNVVFEAGYFIAKLERKNVIIITEEGVEMPGDLSGVVYTTKNDWRINVLKELHNVGLKVDLNKML